MKEIQIMLIGACVGFIAATLFSIIRQSVEKLSKTEKLKTSGLARCRRLRYPTMAMAARLENEEHENDACMVCHACEIPVNSDGRCPKCNSGISNPGRK